MLGFVRGKIISKSPGSNLCTVRAGDVGYEVQVSQRLMESLEIGNEKDFWLHTHVREDILMLYGFESESEKQLFRILIGVSGLGPKTALALLGFHSAPRLVDYIINKQNDEISEAPGVGKKLAQKLTLELAGKLEKSTLSLLVLDRKSKPTSETPVAKERKLRDDLVSALVHLGFQPTAIRNTVDRLLEKEEASLDFETGLRSALRELSNRVGTSNVGEGEIHG